MAKSSTSFKKGHKMLPGSEKGWIKKGQRLSPATEFKEKEKLGYFGLHNWVERKLGVPKICEHCGTLKAKKYEWANKDHKYKKIVDDWIRLCTPCHRKYDIKNNNWKK